MTPLIGPDLDFVTALLGIHPNQSSIIGSGIRHLGVECVPNATHQRRFLIRRTDGSLRDWSWRDALTPESPLKKLTSVLRYGIYDQILSFRVNTAQSTCYNCAEPLSIDSHVDHVAPDTFESIVQNWLAVESLTPEQIEITTRSGYQQHSSLSDNALMVRWQLFHQLSAVLSMACKACNLGVLRHKK